jgi:hypothetical protein
MKKIPKKKKKIILIASIIALILASIILPSPFLILRSNERLRSDMLKLTPIGTSMEDVIKTINESNKWEIRYIYNDSGYSMFGGRPGCRSDFKDSPVNDFIIGEKSIRTFHRGYHAIQVSISIEVYYAFDGDSKLIDVAISKGISP